ncbi:hypothetical protein [Dermatobacter hominis]|uniref:hypothetical protein n=1 Tax=Dermatobacter hominis TaxID=2884263 RepID=UPI001D0F536E|nr:hypothetical protein [Dermatobacter hominis]UDY34012.1 hypothetical protein LH044_11710 [Dermatobacter hominis]
MEPNEHVDDADEPEVVDLTGSPATPATPAWATGPVEPAPAAAVDVPPAPDPIAPDPVVPETVVPVPDAPGPDAPTAEPVPLIADEDDELAVLGRIEQDLAAVEEAMSGLDRIDADQIGGAAAAAQVQAIVGSDRFTAAG